MSSSASFKIFTGSEGREGLKPKPLQTRHGQSSTDKENVNPFANLENIVQKPTTITKQALPREVRSPLSDLTPKSYYADGTSTEQEDGCPKPKKKKNSKRKDKSSVAHKPAYRVPVISMPMMSIR
mmetsp:Transcript_48818/g.110786  ORF Transcript_48818/g.110786 Transcript_48818/m.110786 type:complete len:125 (-) Transcript_48818:328-702(-)